MDALDREALDYKDPVDDELAQDMRDWELHDARILIGKILDGEFVEEDKLSALQYGQAVGYYDRHTRK